MPDKALIRHTLDAFNAAGDQGTRGLLRCQLETLRAGCEHKEFSLLLPDVLLGHVEDFALVDIFQCDDCLLGLACLKAPA